MTKSTITREQLLEIIETDHVQCGEASALASMALAAMDSEPVAWTDEQELRDVDRGGCGYLFTVNPVTPHADERRIILLYRHAQPVLEIESEPVFTLEVASADYKGQKLGNHFGFITLDAARELKDGNYQLYTAQPAPVVPEELPVHAIAPYSGAEYEAGYRDGWNACRAAMLAAAPQPQNAPQNIPEIIPKWIPVSERMPAAGGDVIVFTDGIVMSGVSYAKKKGFYIQALEYDDDEPVDSVTHWMPLPAAPQEAINVLIPLVSRNEQEGK